jgi:5-formyltetrahydrofolate cyclo-ligase
LDRLAGEIEPTLVAVLSDFPAQASGEVGHRANRGVVHALGEADLAEGRVALGDADAKADVVPVPAPGFDYRCRRLAHRHGHLYRALGRLRAPQWVQTV